MREAVEFHIEGLVGEGLPVPEPLSERNALSELRQMAGRNRVYTSMIGQGFYGTVCPPAIQPSMSPPRGLTSYVPQL